jgi:hypothetical protein
MKLLSGPYCFQCNVSTVTMANNIMVRLRVVIDKLPQLLSEICGCDITRRR